MVHHARSICANKASLVLGASSPLRSASGVLRPLIRPPCARLDVTGNRKLRIPKAVIEAGTRCLASYLQTVGEQHRLIDEHLEQFNMNESEHIQGQPLWGGLKPAA